MSFHPHCICLLRPNVTGSFYCLWYCAPLSVYNYRTFPKSVSFFKCVCLAFAKNSTSRSCDPLMLFHSLLQISWFIKWATISGSTGVSFTINYPMCVWEYAIIGTCNGRKRMLHSQRCPDQLLFLILFLVFQLGWSEPIVDHGYQRIRSLKLPGESCCIWHGACNLCWLR